jgi:HEAT repeat protein
VARMARHAEARFRATAAWVMGQTGDPRYVDVLRHMLGDTDEAVRRNARRSLRRLQAAA